MSKLLKDLLKDKCPKIILLGLCARSYLKSSKIRLPIHEVFDAIIDWTQIPDSPLTDAKKAEWTEYRQALRDVPSNNSGSTEVDQVIWPTQPTT